MLTFIWEEGDNTDTIHKTTKALINANKEVGPEVNPDVSSPTHTTKLQQGQAKIKDARKRRKVKLFRTMLRNKNCIHD
jgi:hypothetical protein